MITNTTQRFWGALIAFTLLLWRDRRTRSWLIGLFILLAAGFFIPQQMIIPVKGASI
ncbi:MAG: M23 family peptidase, partial [Eudoraea sp.]|nr:M23 family peptidase [Eudoraea sp.]